MKSLSLLLESTTERGEVDLNTRLKLHGDADGAFMEVGYLDGSEVSGLLTIEQLMSIRSWIDKRLSGQS